MAAPASRARGAWTVTRDPATEAMLLHWPDGTAEPLSLPARLTGRKDAERPISMQVCI